MSISISPPIPDQYIKDLNNTTDIFSFRITDENSEVLDLNGRTVASSLVLNGTAPSRELIDLSDVAKGIYFVSIIDGKSRLVEKLVIK